MAATRGEISAWFDYGFTAGWRFMVVVCDTFDYDDYPKYFTDEAEARLFWRNPGEMQRSMEAYDLSADMQQQMNERRANCFDVAKL